MTCLLPLPSLISSETDVSSVLYTVRAGAVDLGSGAAAVDLDLDCCILVLVAMFDTVDCFVWVSALVY